MRPIKMVGKRFGRAVVLEDAPRKLSGDKLRKQFVCECDCGKQFIALGENLRSGHTNSCGCLQKEHASEARFKHGASHTDSPLHRRAYAAWLAMRQRCTNKTNKRYSSYGGRGIEIDPRWDSFEAFLADMGLPSGTSLSIERIDNNGNYNAANCKWATATEQANNKRTNINLSYKGETKTLTQWARELGLDYGMLKYRIDSGWTTVLAFETPSRKFGG